VNNAASAHIRRLVAEAHALLDTAIDREVHRAGRTLAGIVILFSGGNDSTTVAHLFKGRATHAAHANTGIGIESTRQYVRDTCAAWGLPLLERRPEPGYGYRDLVLGRARAKSGPKRGTILWPGGFPGPAAHWLMYQRLKERALEQVRRELITNPFRQRVVFVAGRRAAESGRRKRLARIPAIERRGSVVWVSPLIHWTALDLNAYRVLHRDVPRNEVCDLLHMSGECLCGSFARSGELDELEFFGFTEPVAQIRRLEREVAAAGVAPPERCRWGWGADKETPSRVGALCSSCSSRFEQLTIDGL
jgi:3'-phosphoadenosine 5'-phosphosulfate sulfotransferase (PAPS reductase)/FAD synthetase